MMIKLQNSLCTFRDEMTTFQSYFASHFQKLEQYLKHRWRRWHRKASLTNDCEFWLGAAGSAINKKLSVLQMKQFADPGITVTVADCK
jgi:hypothetical protein